MPFHFSPPVVFALCALFWILAGVNLSLGRKRLRLARAQGVTIPWYKQASLLTAAEYILLSGVLLLNLGMTNGWFPPSFAGMIVPLYFSLLILAALALGAIVFWSIRRPRGTAITTPSHEKTTTSSESERTLSSEQHTRSQKQRERRKKASIARRRRTGRS